MNRSNYPLEVGSPKALKLALGILFAALISASAQVNVKVDSSLPWLGFMNVWQTNGTAYSFGGAWGLNDLRAAFLPTNSPGWPLHTHLLLRANTNTYNPADVFWNNPDGSPNKVLEANFYRDVGTNFGGQTVTFTGSVLSNNIPGLVNGHPATGWTIQAVVKEFNTTYSTFYGMAAVDVTNPGAFLVSRAIPAGRVCQYGFILKGPNAVPGSANALASIGILVEDPDPAITTQPGNVTTTSTATTNLTVVAVGSGPLAYQWKTNGVPLVNGSKYSGVNGATLTINNCQVADSGAYTVTVSNTVTHTTVDSNPSQLNVLDILVTASPADQRVEQGGTASFSVTANSSAPLTYLWRSVINGVTNFVINGTNVSGANAATLTLSNLPPTSSGLYFVTITSSNGSVRLGANLIVKTYADYPNFLDNPGFENDTNGVNESPWVRFESSDPSYGHFQSTNDLYFGGGNVNVLEGKYVSFTTYSPGGGYSGIYQDIKASPGQTFAADVYFYNASGDPIPGPSVNATNDNYLEIQFRDANNNPIRQFTTSLPALTYNTPQNVWFQLQATNAGNYGYNPSTINTRYLVAPANTTTVRFQLTMHDVANSVAAGSIYYDSARLMLKLPVTVQSSVQGGNFVLSWKSLGSTSYQVQYADSLNGPWQNLGSPVSGTGQTVSKSDPLNPQRFYRVLTL
jgi:hypothetical protein